MLKLYKILEEVESPVNGKIQVVKTLDGIKIMVGGIPQTSRLVKDIWNSALRKLKAHPAKRVLILGLGGGVAAELVANYWPEARLVGVDKDPLMINLGKKYFSLDAIERLEIVEADAGHFVARKTKEKYDLILVDLYLGSKIPEQFKTVDFFKKVRNLLSRGGIACFNHLYSWQEKEEAANFARDLREVFSVLEEVKPEANIIFICRNN